MDLPHAESYKIKMVENISKSTRTQREEWAEEAKFNMFNLKSRQVYIDLLSDSGTGAMSDKQWAEMMLGDESYAGATSYEKLQSSVENIFGFPHFLPVHQGRAAENVLFSCLIKEGDIVPGNTHFDTTKGHIEYRRAAAVDCTIDEAFDTEVYHPFKGNIDLKKLEAVLSENPQEKIPLIIITVTCNASGGQPVSMKNIEDVFELAQKYQIPLCFDACRFAENAYFIKMREEGYYDMTIKDIAKQMFSFADMATMSGKKDGYCNMGGFIGYRDEDITQKASTYCIMFEGFLTYGGMSGRDMNALAQGLDDATKFDTLESRIKQLEYLSKQLIKYNIPHLKPVGGSALYVDARSFVYKIPKEEYPAQLLVNELYLEAGVRGGEVGTVIADRCPVTRENRYPKIEYVRLAVPRRTYTNNHMDVVAVALKNIYDRRDSFHRGLEIIWEGSIMRHFTAKFKRL